MKFLSILFLLITLLSCGKDNNYVYLNRNIENLQRAETHTIIGDTGKVDILWIIDNSGSMSTIQNDVIANTDKFIQSFSQIINLDWKMGLVSTSIDESPYLGFSTPFSHTNPDPIGEFQRAVTSLGTMGSAEEITLETVVKHLNANPNFLRNDAHFIMIMVSDEEEQSRMSVPDFVQDILRRKSGNVKMFKAFGAFNARDFGCSIGTTFDYSGDQFDQVIKATNGKVYSACTPDFGSKLADLGKEIISTVASKVLLLKERPIAKSIKIEYMGHELPGGREEDGGKWIYDPEMNAIRFHNYDFVDFNFKNVEIAFDVDQGLPDFF